MGCWISYEGKYKVFLLLCMPVSALDRLRVLFIFVLEGSVLGIPWPYYSKKSRMLAANTILLNKMTYWKVSWTDHGPGIFAGPVRHTE